jgi:hypothetical protein
MTQTAKIGISLALGLVLLLLAVVSFEEIRWMMQPTPDVSVNATAASVPIKSNPQTTSAQDIPVGTRQAAAEMHSLLTGCRDYAAKHRSNWPKTLNDLRPSLSDQTINFDDYIYCYFGYKLFDRMEAVMVERNPRKGGGQLIGFADGHVEWDATFDWHRPIRDRDSDVILSPVYDAEWPDNHGHRVGIEYTFNDPLDVPDAPRVVVGREILMSGNCFQSAEVVANPDGTAGIRLIPAFNMRDLLHSHTRENVNHRLAAMLVEKGEPQLLGAPLIHAPMDNALLLTGPFKADEAANLAARINIALKEIWAKYGPPKR